MRKNRDIAKREFTIADRVIAVDDADPALYIVSTPIGNLEDISIRALRVLAGVDRIACEDTRISRRLLNAYGIRTPLSSYHEHNAAKTRPALISGLQSGESIALISDAGTPLISDPGYKLVEKAVECGVRVIPVPGPSAGIAALSASGLPSDSFVFAGFLPPKRGARTARIQSLSKVDATIVLYEAPSRIAESLNDLEAELGPDRPAVLARELTKTYEEFRRGTLRSLAQSVAEDPPRGEIVLLVGPPQADARADPDEVDRLIANAPPGTPLKSIAADVAAKTGWPKRAVYNRALQLRGDRTGA